LRDATLKLEVLTQGAHVPHIAYVGKNAEHFLQGNDWNYFEKHKCPKCGVVVAVYLSKDARPTEDEWKRGTDQIAVSCPSHDNAVIYVVVGV
jgi:phage FluMu protein Com